MNVSQQKLEVEVAKAQQQGYLRGSKAAADTAIRTTIDTYQNMIDKLQNNDLQKQQLILDLKNQIVGLEKALADAKLVIDAFQKPEETAEEKPALKAVGKKDKK